MRFTVRITMNGSTQARPARCQWWVIRSGDASFRNIRSGRLGVL
ncbi:hypothetical protein GZL_08594 [Streptomyces sp. 769]|nr:hypothetical protein GZL_08594 [Streptomyces sp. 769]